MKEYNLTIEQNEMTLGGVTAKAMTVNGSIPGPVLEFTIGDLAIINVINKMDEETSVQLNFTMKNTAIGSSIVTYFTT